MRSVIVAVWGVLLAAAAEGVPPDLVTAVDTEFVKEGKAYRFIGVDIRGLVHYGGGDGALPYTNLGHIDENLAGARDMGCRVVRVFAANKNISHQDAVNRLGYALNKAQQYNQKLIIALTDFYPTPFHPQGDDGYYTVNPWEWTVLNDAWFSGGYQNNYLPYVTLAVSTYKDHPAVFSWQLGNELAGQTNPAHFETFVHTVAAHIKSIDPYHMVSTGMLSVTHLPGWDVPQGVALYSDPNLDFITVHSYNGSDHNNVDFSVRSAVVKPVLVSEAGCDTSVNGGDRVGFMNQQVNDFVNTRGARGYMHWGYQAQAWDIGDGDNVYGFDRYAHPDYNAMYAMYQAHAATLNAYNTPVEHQRPPQGRNLAPESTAWQTDSTYSPSYAAPKAFDRLLATKWCSTNATSSHWLALDLGQARWITGYVVRLAGAGGEWTTYNWKHYVLQTGSSLSGPWVTDLDVSNSLQLNAPPSGYAMPKLARYVRVYVDQCGIDNYARLPEFEVYGADDLSELRPQADFDGDRDVDLADAALLQACFRGADQPHPGPVGAFDCAAANLDRGGDDPWQGDVDLDDYAAFEACWTGPDEPLPVECYGCCS